MRARQRDGGACTDRCFRDEQEFRQGIRNVGIDLPEKEVRLCDRMVAPRITTTCGCSSCLLPHTHKRPRTRQHKGLPGISLETMGVFDREVAAFAAAPFLLLPLEIQCHRLPDSQIHPPCAPCSDVLLKPAYLAPRTLKPNNARILAHPLPISKPKTLKVFAVGAIK